MPFKSNFILIHYKKIISKRCCGITLRAGCITIAIIGILIHILYLCISRSYWPQITIGVFGLIPNGFLLHGAIKNNNRTVLVYLVSNTVVFVFYAIIFIISMVDPEILYSIDGKFTDHEKNIWRFNSAVFAIIDLIVYIASLVFCFNFYKDLNEKASMSPEKI